MIIRNRIRGLIFIIGILGGLPLAADETQTWDGKFIQYGRMHEAIGQQQHQGRVHLDELIARPHFYGVAALEGLSGEATILDGRVTVTMVDTGGRIVPGDNASPDTRATLLVGAYVPSWTEHKITHDVGPDKFDQFVADLATQAGHDLSEPFVFTVEGEFSNVRLHVIHGACPLHARLKNIEIPKERRPFEAEFEKISGAIVGVFAKDAVGDITHPATATHAHLLFQDADSGKMATGHVERLGLRKGATLRLPKLNK